MTISGLARAGGVGVETVRYYQRRGLLDVPAKAPGFGLGTGPRHYGAADVQRLRFVRTAQVAGFSLDEIGELLRLDAARDRARVRALAAARLATLDRHLAELRAARDWLQALRRECLAEPRGPCPILQAFADPALAPAPGAALAPPEPDAKP